MESEKKLSKDMAGVEMEKNGFELDHLQSIYRVGKSFIRLFRIDNEAVKMDRFLS